LTDNQSIHNIFHRLNDVFEQIGNITISNYWVLRVYSMI